MFGAKSYVETFVQAGKKKENTKKLQNKHLKNWSYYQLQVDIMYIATRGRVIIESYRQSQAAFSEDGLFLEDQEVWVRLSVVSLLNKCETTLQSFTVASPQKPHVDILLNHFHSSAVSCSFWSQF